MHLALAAMTKTPELKLEKAEADQLGEAVARVNKEFGGFVLSPKAAAIINLATVGGTLYGPRMFAHALRMKREKQDHAAGRTPAPAKEPITINADPVRVQ